MDDVYVNAMKGIKVIMNIVVNEIEIINELIEIYNSIDENHIKCWLIKKKDQLFEIKTVIDGIFLKYYSVSSLLQICLNKISLMKLGDINEMVLPLTLKEKILNYSLDYNKFMLDKFSNVTTMMNLIIAWNSQSEND